MINDESLRRALGTLERHAPPEADVLAGLRRGIARRRRRRRVASTLGVAGVAALVALGVVLVKPDRGGSPPATSTPAPSPSVKIATPPAPPALPFTVGSLPAGFTLSSWQISPNWTFAHWAGTRDFESVSVDYSAKPQQGTVINGEEDVTIAGRPGKLRRYSGNGGSGHREFLWQLPNGWWAAVHGRVPTVPLATIRAVAESLTTQPMPLPASAGLALSTLPDGYQVNTWGGNDSTVGHMGLCRSPDDIQDMQEQPDCVSLNVKEGTAPAFTETFVGTVHAPTMIPVDREKVVNGVLSRATADGTLVFVQLDAGHYGIVTSRGAGADLLREVASYLTVR